MKTYDVDKALMILKPIRFKSYSNFRRIFANAVIAFSNFFARPKKGIKKRVFKIKGYQHGTIKVYYFQNKHLEGKQKAILYLHGGGFQMEGTPVHIKMITDMMIETNYQAVYVKYRMFPKHRFPTALEDSYHALLWMHEHADFLEIDINHLAIAGDSAGGNLAIGVSMLARDRKGPKINKMICIYPVIDHTMQTASMKNYDDTPMWNSNLNAAMWKEYLKQGDFGMLNYTSFLSSDLSNMPETYIETAEYDCLRDEGILFAEKMKKAGNKVYTFHTKGTVHGYDAAFFTDLVKSIKENRNLFLKGTLHEES